jgi:tight adherence protein B
MAAVLLTFVVALAIVVGAYWIFVVRIEDQAQATVRRRLTKKSDSVREKARAEILKQTSRVSHVGFIERLLERQGSFFVRLQKRLDQADVKMTSSLFLLTSGVIGLAAYVAVSFFTPWIAIAALAGLIALFLPTIWLQRKRATRLKLIEEQFPDAIDLIARALRAGHAFTTGIGMVSEEVPAPTGPEFQLLYEHQNFGMPLPDALKRFAERVDLLDARFFVTAVLTQREAGGNLSEVLDNLSTVIRERFKVKRQVRVLSAHGRLTGIILMSMPPIMALMLFQLSPESTSLLVTDPLGIRMLIGAAILQIIGALIIKKIVNVEY